MKQKIAVIGGAGHVGLGLCLILADCGQKVFGIDIDEAANYKIMNGNMPFLEENGNEFLNRAIASGNLNMSKDYSLIAECDVVVIVPGTPVDENMNPRLEVLQDIIRECSPYLQTGQLIILRSTVLPGTTEHVRILIEKNTKLRSGIDFHLIYAPERVVQGKSLIELPILPQIIGAFEEKSFELSKSFFSIYLHASCLFLTPVEAELGKLITNMARYVEFAFANEVYILAETWGADANRIISNINLGYPRLNIPTPGPNVGGPCLYKDGHFLVERIPFPELIRTAFHINEGMPAQLIMKLQAIGGLQRIAILGMTFKAGSDDIRNSLSFKLRKQLLREHFEVTCLDPYVEKFSDWSALYHVDAIVLMTPHPEFSELSHIRKLVDNDNCVILDLWGHWSIEPPLSNNGVFVIGKVFE